MGGWKIKGWRSGSGSSSGLERSTACQQLSHTVPSGSTAWIRSIASSNEIPAFATGSYSGEAMSTNSMRPAVSLRLSMLTSRIQSGQSPSYSSLSSQVLALLDAVLAAAALVGAAANEDGRSRTGVGSRRAPDLHITISALFAYCFRALRKKLTSAERPEAEVELSFAHLSRGSASGS